MLILTAPEVQATSDWVIGAGAGTLFCIALLTTLAKLGIIQRRDDQVDKATVEELAKINGNLRQIVVILGKMDDRAHRIRNMLSVIRELIVNKAFRDDWRETPPPFEKEPDEEKKGPSIQEILDKLDPKGQP